LNVVKSSEENVSGRNIKTKKKEPNASNASKANEYRQLKYAAKMPPTSGPIRGAASGSAPIIPFH
jgi:hypothetical protein